MVPQPVLAVLMLFPVTDASEKAKAEEDARLKVCACRFMTLATAAPMQCACRRMRPLPCHVEQVSQASALPRTKTKQNLAPSSQCHRRMAGQGASALQLRGRGRLEPEKNAARAHTRQDLRCMCRRSAVRSRRLRSVMCTSCGRPSATHAAPSLSCMPSATIRTSSASVRACQPLPHRAVRISKTSECGQAGTQVLPCAPSTVLNSRTAPSLSAGRSLHNGPCLTQTEALSSRTSSSRPATWTP